MFLTPSFCVSLKMTSKATTPRGIIWKTPLAAPWPLVQQPRQQSSTGTGTALRFPPGCVTSKILSWVMATSRAPRTLLPKRLPELNMYLHKGDILKGAAPEAEGEAQMVYFTVATGSGHAL